jgi:response regulator RpfG family c-di-GMP phosphodiesterase
MDMQMPIMDGVTTTKIIRQEIKSDIPIIAFTANALKKEKDRCLAIGMDDYVSKPFEEIILKSKIINLISRNQSREELSLNNPQMKPNTFDSIFSMKKLQELSRGNNIFIKKMLTIFCEDGQIQLKQINNSSDPDEIGRIAHKIKPSIDYLSNNAMISLVRRIEKKEFIEEPSLLLEFTKKLESMINLASLELK